MAEFTIQMTRQSAHANDGDIHGALMEEVEDRSYEGARWLTFMNGGLAALHRGDDPAANERDESMAVDLIWFLFAAADVIPAEPDLAAALVDTEAARAQEAIWRRQPDNAPDVAPDVLAEIRRQLGENAPDAGDAELDAAAGYLFFIQRCAVAVDKDDVDEKWMEAAAVARDLASERRKPAITTLDAIVHVGRDHLSDVDRMSALLDEEAELHLGRPGECGNNCPAFAIIDVDGELVAADPYSALVHVAAMCEDLEGSENIAALVRSAISQHEDREARL